MSAWAYLTDSQTHNSTIVSQASNDARNAGFDLYYSTGYRKWVFNWHWTDTAGAVHYVRSLADAADPPTRVWTQLTGVYDADAKRIQLYLNGEPQGAPVPVSGADIPTVTSGPLQVGRINLGVNAYSNYAFGLVDEVRTWQRPLTADEVALDAELLGDNGPATALVGRWSAAEAGGTSSVADTSAYARAAMTLSTGAQLDTTRGVVTLDGTAGAATTTGPVVDETGSFTVTANVALDSAKLAAKPNGYRAQVIGQRSAVGGPESSWGIWYEQVDTGGGPLGQWVFGRTGVDGNNTVVAQAAVVGGEAAAMDTLVQLTGVYDALEDRLHLYVSTDDQPADEKAVFTHRQQGGGELSAGRGMRAGTWQDQLPGELAEVRVWAGALTYDQIINQVLGA